MVPFAWSDLGSGFAAVPGCSHILMADKAWKKNGGPFGFFPVDCCGFFVLLYTPPKTNMTVEDHQF